MLTPAQSNHTIPFVETFVFCALLASFALDNRYRPFCVKVHSIILIQQILRLHWQTLSINLNFNTDSNSPRCLLPRKPLTDAYINRIKKINRKYI